jgi:hypothetical protein
MRFFPLVGTAVTILIAANVTANEVIPLVIDVGTGEIRECGSARKPGSPAAGGAPSKPTLNCLLGARTGSVVSVLLTNALPGLLTYNVDRTLMATQELPAELALSLGLATPKPAASPAVPAPAGPPPAQPPEIAAYNALSARVEEFNSLLAGRYTNAEYVTALQQVHTARASVLSLLKVPDLGATVAAALANVAAISIPTSQVAASWDALQRLLSIAPSRPVDLGPFLFTYEDRDFNVVITATPTAVLPTVSVRVFAIPVREKYGWKWTTTTGFAFSGLTDQNFSARTVVVTPASGNTPAVTRKELVQEATDGLRPEPIVLVHLSPIHHSFAERIALSLGVSLTPSGPARIYSGLSWRLGQIGALTVGAAAGSVKRLSRNVDTSDIGTADPQQLRRDLLLTRVFASFSLRFAASK